VSERYEFIDAEKDVVADAGGKKYTVRKMCAWLRVSVSGYYEWRGRPDSAKRKRRAYLSGLITAIFDASDQTYGHRRVHAQLLRQGESCTPELVRRLMRQLGLVACQPRPWRHSLTEADPAASPIPDLLNRDFTAAAPGEKMVGDITYISTPGKDGSTSPPSSIATPRPSSAGPWTTTTRPRSSTRPSRWQHATTPYRQERYFTPTVGSNYTSARFAATLESVGIRQSVGRTGICYDDSMAESFFGTLKNECVHRTIYPHANEPLPTSPATPKYATTANASTQHSTWSSALSACSLSGRRRLGPRREWIAGVAMTRGLSAKES
jgi:putative transposase